MERPYIESKPMFMATDFACRMIRQHEPRQRSINVAAKYYGVDAKELATHVRDFFDYRQYKRETKPVPDWENRSRKCSKCGTVSFRKYSMPCPFCFYVEK